MRPPDRTSIRGVERARHLVAHQIDLVVEVTPPSNFQYDREPVQGPARKTKWQGYAYAAVPYYLLIDRDPRLVRVTLYSEPGRRSGVYQNATHWDFGEKVILPDPFGFEVDTADWESWDV